MLIGELAAPPVSLAVLRPLEPLAACHTVRCEMASPSPLFLHGSVALSSARKRGSACLGDPLLATRGRLDILLMVVDWLAIQRKRYCPRRHTKASN